MCRELLGCAYRHSRILSRIPETTRLQDCILITLDANALMFNMSLVRARAGPVGDKTERCGLVAVVICVC